MLVSQELTDLMEDLDQKKDKWYKDEKALFERFIAETGLSKIKSRGIETKEEFLLVRDILKQYRVDSISAMLWLSGSCSDKLIEQKKFEKW